MTILSGVRVIEFTHMVAGPACGQVLADFGAEVVKVEPPGGDITRRLGPGNGTVSALFAGTNRNKASVCLDLRDPADAARARALVLNADVIISNVDSAMLDKAGLSPSVLREANPALIVVEITAFGRGGPLGTDGIAQAAMGLMDLTGEAGGASFRTGPSVVDVSTGVWAALGVLAALERRRMTGRGDLLTTNLADVCLYMQYSQMALYSAAPELVRRNGNHSMISCTPVLEASDGRVMLTLLHDRHWAVLCDLLGENGVTSRADLSTNEQRCDAQTLIETLLNPAFRTRTRAEWLAVLRARRIPCGPVRGYGEVAADPDLRARGMLYALDNAGGGRTLQVRMPLSFDEYIPDPPRPAPALGATERHES